MTIDQLQDEIVDEFSDIEDWMDRYAYIIDLGNALPAIDEKYKTPAHIIEGCQSRVWLNAEMIGDKVVYTADSDAIIVKGIISLLIKVLSEHTPMKSLMRSYISLIGLGYRNICLPHAVMDSWQW